MDGEPSRDDQNESVRPKEQNPLKVRERRAEGNEYDSERSGDHTANEQRPTHSLKILFKGHSLLEWIEAVLTLILALVGIFYTFYAAKQWQAMRDTLNKTDTALELNRQALELNRQALVLNGRQTVANEASAKAAGQSVEVAKTAIVSSQISSHIDQRPYLVVEGTGWVTDHGPSDHTSIALNANFRNIGRTPAVGIVLYRKLFFHRSEQNSNTFRAMIDNAFAEARPKATGSTQDVAPQGTFYTTGQIASMSAEELKAVQESRGAIYFIGGAIYKGFRRGEPRNRVLLHPRRNRHYPGPLLRSP